VAGQQRPAWDARGQHVLRSKQLAASLVAEAKLGNGELVLEIGGGTGVLTRALVHAGANVLVIERDPVLAGQLRTHLGHLDAVTVVEGDALEQRLPAESLAVIANLPFARSGAILARLLSDPRVPLRGMHVIVQWEFAVKHAAVWPTTLRGTYWRAWYEVAVTRRLDRSAFAPAPSVDAAVLQFERRANPPLPPDWHEAYWRFLSDAFATQRPIRRCLRPALSAQEIKRLALALGFGLDARARDLDAEQWAKLFAFTKLGPPRQQQQRD
jgi:23S rRNA (adenine-N6)-dimethyltransferase